MTVVQTLGEGGPTDTELLRAARHSADAFCEFYDRRADGLFTWLVRETGDAEIAADLAAESFAQALVSLHRFRGVRSDSGVAWLYGIARNLLSSYRRRDRLEARARRRLGIPVEAVETSDYFDVEERLADGEQREQLTTMLSELPHEQRSAIELRIVLDLPYEDVAERLNCSPVAARLRVSRGLRTLRGRLAGGIA